MIFTSPSMSHNFPEDFEDVSWFAVGVEAQSDWGSTLTANPQTSSNVL